MNKFLDNKIAVLKYNHGEFDVVHDGQYVLCSIIVKKIDINEIKYWSVEKQEVYESAEIALLAHKRSIDL